MAFAPDKPVCNQPTHPYYLASFAGFDTPNLGSDLTLSVKDIFIQPKCRNPYYRTATMAGQQQAPQRMETKGVEPLSKRTSKILSTLTIHFFVVRTEHISK